MTLVRRYRAKAELLLASGRLDAAQAAFARAEGLFAKAGPDVEERALLQAARADLLPAAKRPADALPLYRQALGPLEARDGRGGLALVDALLGLGAAELDSGDAAAAIASAERAVAIDSASSGPADEIGAAEFLLARARWAAGEDRAGAVALARSARERLARLPYPADALPEIDRWLAHR